MRDNTKGITLSCVQVGSHHEHCLSMHHKYTEQLDQIIDNKAHTSFSNRLLNSKTNVPKIFLDGNIFISAQRFFEMSATLVHFYYNMEES